MRNNKHLHTTGHPHTGHRARGLLARPRVCRLAWRLCCAAVAVCLFSCDSDQPDYLEPRLTTLPATDLTRTEATLHGSATVAGETEMPQLYFRYGATEAMEQTARQSSTTRRWWRHASHGSPPPPPTTICSRAPTAGPPCGATG